MIEVNLHNSVIHFEYMSHEAITIFILKRNNSILVYVLIIEMTINIEHLLI